MINGLPFALMKYSLKLLNDDNYLWYKTKLLKVIENILYVDYKDIVENILTNKMIER